jgi:hypothetical protein
MLSTLGIHWHLQTIHFIHYIKPSKKLKKVGEKMFEFNSVDQMSWREHYSRMWDKNDEENEIFEKE